MILRGLGSLCAFCLLATSPVRALDLVAEGQPRTTIVIPDEPLPVHKAAAEELQYHVRRASGAELPIVAEGAAKAERIRKLLAKANLGAALRASNPKRPWEK